MAPLCVAALVAVCSWATILATTKPYAFKPVRILGGGFVTGTVFSKAVKGLAYARTDMGGMYKWNSTSDAWIPLQDDLGWSNQTFQGTLSIATDAVAPNRVYVACGEYTWDGSQPAAVLRSDAQGALGSWTASPLPIHLGGNEDGRGSGERLSIDTLNNSVLYLGTSRNGMWISQDAAVTWSALASWPLPNASIMFVLQLAPSGVLLVGIDATGAQSLQASHDSGATWQAVPGCPTSLIPFRGAPDADRDTVYFTYANGVGPNDMTAGAVWKWSITSGLWTDITPSQAVGLGGGFAGLGTDAQTPGTVMVTTNDRWTHGDDIYRSVDKGSTWTALVGDAVLTYDAPWVAFHTSPPSWTPWIQDIAIDPFNSDHAVHGTGRGLWATWDATQADDGRPTHWAFNNDGLEQTVPLELVSPPAGPPLVSAILDVDGFRHDDLDVSPPQGMFYPSWGTGFGLDVAWFSPQFYVRTHFAGYNASLNTVHGSYSSDGGYNFTTFKSQPSGAGMESIAVTCDGRTILWHGHFSRDNGTTWTSCGGVGLPPTASPFTDRVNASYAYAVSGGSVWVSSDGGATFQQGARDVPPPITSFAGTMRARVSFDQQGHLWLPTSKGLFRSVDHGASIVQVAGPETVYSVGLGAAMGGAGAYPAVYIHGVVGAVEGFFRSDDQASTWTRVNDWDSKYGLVYFLQGDPKTPGRLYVASSGRGILYGDSQA